MQRQKSFENGRCTLYLVPTPIGNLNEMTPRAIEVLNSVDVIACEDTRTSGTLLKHFGIRKKLIACQNFNEANSAKGIAALLEQGLNVALISDAGYPLISDPGQRVVDEVTSAGYNVVPLSGPNAMLNALVASGLIVQPFVFIGFLPASVSECRTKLQTYRDYPMTMVFYEAPHRIVKMLSTVLEVLGDRKCCIAREITKIHEEFLRGTVSELLEAMKEEARGEMVVIIEGKTGETVISEDTIRETVGKYLAQGMRTSSAVKEAAKELGLNKNRVYDLVHEKEDEAV
ncbi:MAG: 16S rRNA (cytidine(1402)-2'-O)-methyltransferase [Solobacterium sp.]|nr:16S rRNA (cytidine(1402)-2'-O)-methyltransferase [Solobacterium sp.]